MAIKYTDNKNQQVLLVLLKKFGIRKAIISPGGTNPAFVASLQSDPFFEIYSCVDERSSAYMACGMAEESQEPVIICCTGATASRNYMPALTEAFYRNLPIVAVTCSRDSINIGQMVPQVTDRTQYPSDIFVDTAQLQNVKDDVDYRDCVYKVNRCLLALKFRKGGPVHFNVLCSTQSCSTDILPDVDMINRIVWGDQMPPIKAGRIGVFIGCHSTFNTEETKEIDKFCELHNAVVFCDHTSGYHGNYGIHYSLIGTQVQHTFDLCKLDLLIHIGGMSGDYKTTNFIEGKQVWRVSEDGIIRMTFNREDYVFAMRESDFFKYYTKNDSAVDTSFFDLCNEVYNHLFNSIPNLPFSNIWIAKYLSLKLKDNCVLHLAILNSLRSWNFFKVKNKVNIYSNVGGFGIDGCTSSMIGASLVNPNKIYLCITGDLAFFYDLNVIGNRHIGSNVRILLINNGVGAEFTHFQASKYHVNERPYIGGAGHFGNMSKELVKNFSSDLGFTYLSASNKEDFEANIGLFLEKSEKPMVMECFVDDLNQSKAWEMLSNLEPQSHEDKINEMKSTIKTKARNCVSSIKSLLK